MELDTKKIGTPCGVPIFNQITNDINISLLSLFGFDYFRSASESNKCPLQGLKDQLVLFRKQRLKSEFDRLNLIIDT